MRSVAHPDLGMLNLLWCNWQTIRDEALALDPHLILNSDREGKSHAQVMEELVQAGPHWIPGWGDKAHWLNWAFLLNDTFPLGDTGCPKTCSLLGRIKGLKVAALSLFKPGALLPLHHHPELATEGLLTFHLGLSVTPPCYLWSNGQFYPEEAGTPLVFDGSLPHFAFNASNQDRIILYCEFAPSHR
jgi:beta-hydroxylase